MTLNSGIPLSKDMFWSDNSGVIDVTPLLDGDLETAYNPGFNPIITPVRTNIEMNPGTSVKKIEILYKYGGSFATKLIIEKLDGTEVLVGTFTPPGFSQNGTWLPFNVTGVFEAKRVILESSVGGAVYGQGLRLTGDYDETYTPSLTLPTKQPISNMMDVNAFGWNLNTDAERTAFLSTGSKGVRLYTDAASIEDEKNVMGFNPSILGGNYYDDLYSWLTQQGFYHHSALQGQPQYRQRDWATHNATSHRNVAYNQKDDKYNPAIWVGGGEFIYNWVSRFGKSGTPSYTPYVFPWNGAPVNTVKVALNNAGYVEFGNEQDQFWNGADNFMNGKQIAVAASVAYDGHKGAYAKCGVKSADPSFKMILTGLATSKTDTLEGIKDWTIKNRGYKTNGKINWPFDVIAFHHYSFTGSSNQKAGGTQVGLPPELDLELALKRFVAWVAKNCPEIELQLGEWGNDRNQGSPMKAPAYGSFSVDQVQAMWGARTILVCATSGITRAQYFRLYQDSNEMDLNPTQFETMALLRDNENGSYSRRLIGDYWKQLSEFGSYVNTGGTLQGQLRTETYKSGTDEIKAVWTIENFSNGVFSENIISYSVPAGTVIRRFVDGGSAMSVQTLTATTNLSVGSSPIFIITPAQNTPTPPPVPNPTGKQISVKFYRTELGKRIYYITYTDFTYERFTKKPVGW